MTTPEQSSSLSVPPQCVGCKPVEWAIRCANEGEYSYFITADDAAGVEKYTEDEIQAISDTVLSCSGLQKRLLGFKTGRPSCPQKEALDGRIAPVRIQLNVNSEIPGYFS